MIRVFHQKLLGTTRGRSEDQARWVARGGLFALRIAAFRARLATERNLSGSAFEELSARVFGTPLPASWHGVFPRVRGHEATVWSGLLEALDVEGTLMDRFDEDWFLNPRAAEFLRANLAGPAWEPADEAGWDERAQRLAQEMQRRAT
jgi:hypothetical protein